MRSAKRGGPLRRPRRNPRRQKREISNAGSRRAYNRRVSRVMLEGGVNGSTYLEHETTE